MALQRQTDGCALLQWPETRVTIRRTHVVQDGFAKLGGLRAELKGATKVLGFGNVHTLYVRETMNHESKHLLSRCRDTPDAPQIHFVNERGLDESGIDMGGLYKEFVTAFIEQVR